MAQILNADFEIVAWNGKGIITSYVGEEEDAVPDKSWLIPMLYKYTDAGCCRDYFKEPEEKWELWEHSRFEPDIITIYLGTMMQAIHVDTCKGRGVYKKLFRFSWIYTYKTSRCSNFMYAWYNGPEPVSSCQQCCQYI